MALTPIPAWTPSAPSATPAQGAGTIDTPTAKTPEDAATIDTPTAATGEAPFEPSPPSA